MKFETKTIHAGQKPDPLTGAIMVPVYLSSTFVQEEPGVHSGYEYSRSGNPTRKALEECVASLENVRFGTAYASGLAAEATFLKLFKTGDHIVCSDDLYGGSHRLFTIMDRFGIEITAVDMRDHDALKNSIKENTKLIWMETPTNPTLKILDIKSICDFAKSKNILTIVDNTFLSPYLQNPCDLGADVVLHSSTKYLNGHTDVLGGFLATDSEELHEQITYMQNAAGAIPSPFDCYLILRGLKTLAVRMDRHQENAVKVAEFLSNHKKIEKVIYPGLLSHPDHDLMKEQMRGPGGMITFIMKDGVTPFLKGLKIVKLAESLGGVESLINHPAKMTHGAMPHAQREKLGITNNLLRLSVGIESVEDILEDLKTALNNA